MSENDWQLKTLYILKSSQKVITLHYFNEVIEKLHYLLHFK